MRNTDSAAPCCKLPQWVRAERGWLASTLVAFLKPSFFMNVAVKSAILFSRAVVANDIHLTQWLSPAVLTVVKNSADVGKLCTSIKASFPVAEARNTQA